MQDVLQETDPKLRAAGIVPQPGTVVHYQTPVQLLPTLSTLRDEGHFCENGALVIDTGKFTGRSPKDRFIVKDAFTDPLIDWNAINQPFSAKNFQRIRRKMQHYLSAQELWIRDGYACADPKYRLNVRLLSEKPWASLFVHNMLLRPDQADLDGFQPEWTLMHAPDFEAEPERDGTRSPNFVLINFTEKQILIGGTRYTGEIKKGIFAVLNALLPHEKGVLSMHCSANAGPEGDTALFFGLSGTGKTTLSNDPERFLIGDDEHGWSADGIFNFEGGCYAKCLDLSAEKEPQIFDAIRAGALMENVDFYPGSFEVDYTNSTRTQNTRVSYPIDHLENRKPGSMGAPPKHLFFLTCDAYGVLPPVSRLSVEQAMYHFLCGYTAKVAGTEAGVEEPQATFSACFAAPFLPLHPTVYANLLGEKLAGGKVHCWLINTGWSGGKFGQASRIALAHTRAIVRAVLTDALTAAPVHQEPVFGLSIPDHCPGVPHALLNPRESWPDQLAYDKQAQGLAKLFHAHFAQYAEATSAAVRAAGPRV